MTREIETKNRLSPLTTRKKENQKEKGYFYDPEMLRKLGIDVFSAEGLYSLSSLPERIDRLPENDKSAMNELFPPDGTRGSIRSVARTQKTSCPTIIRRFRSGINMIKEDMLRADGKVVPPELIIDEEEERRRIVLTFIDEPTFTPHNLDKNQMLARLPDVSDRQLRLMVLRYRDRMPAIEIAKSEKISRSEVSRELAEGFEILRGNITIDREKRGKKMEEERILNECNQGRHNQKLFEVPPLHRMIFLLYLAGKSKAEIARGLKKYQSNIQSVIESTISYIQGKDVKFKSGILADRKEVISALERALEKDGQNLTEEEQESYNWYKKLEGKRKEAIDLTYGLNGNNKHTNEQLSAYWGNSNSMAIYHLSRAFTEFDPVKFKDPVKRQLETRRLNQVKQREEIGLRIIYEILNGSLGNEDDRKTVFDLLGTLSPSVQTKFLITLGLVDEDQLGLVEKRNASETEINLSKTMSHLLSNFDALAIAEFEHKLQD